MNRRTAGRSRIAALAFLATLPTSGFAQAPRPFDLPRDRATWEARRVVVLRELEAEWNRDLSPRPASPQFEKSRREAGPWIAVERFAIDAGAEGSDKVDGLLVVPDGFGPGARRVPLILLVGRRGENLGWIVETSGPDGRPVARTLAELGYASLTLSAFGVYARDVRALRIALDAALARPEFEPGRVGVVGLGEAAGVTALGLIALDERVRCGVAAIESADLRSSAPGAVRFEELAALCAPRPVSLMIGEAEPIRSGGPARLLERAAKGTYEVYGPEGAGLALNVFAEFPGHDRVATRLQWMAALEQLDKHLRPQGPTPLGHDPKPEPAEDGTFVDLAERGIAGWSAEMAQRPGTWSWSGGVIACRPGPGEFGWLRAPIEVGDFVLKVEWKVPEHGNGGIFLRSRPVEWTLPPGDRDRPRLQALGLDWPSRTGLELQAQDDPGVADRYSSGSLYRHAAPAANPTRPPGQWNRYTIRARGPRVEVWSNGRQVLDADLDGLPTLPNPPLRGYIGLQNHGSQTEYRAVKLKRLEP